MVTEWKDWHSSLDLEVWSLWSGYWTASWHLPQNLLIKGLCPIWDWGSRHHIAIRQSTKCENLDIKLSIPQMHSWAFIIKDILSQQCKKQAKLIQQFLPVVEPMYLSSPPCMLHLVIAGHEHSAFQYGAQGSAESMMNLGDPSLAVRKSPCSYSRHILIATTLIEYQWYSNKVGCAQCTKQNTPSEGKERGLRPQHHNQWLWGQEHMCSVAREVQPLCDLALSALMNQHV